MNISKKTLTAKTLQKFFLNFWSVFSILIIMVALFGSFSASFLSEYDSKSETISQSNYFDYLPTSTTNQIVVHNYFTLSYNEKHE